MKNIVWAAGDVITPLGDVDSTWNSMIEGRSGLRKMDIPCCGTEYNVGLIPGLDGSFGTLSRMRSLTQQLVESVLTKTGPLPEDTPLFVATTKGAVDQLLKDDTSLGGHPWQLGREIQQQLGLRKPGTNVSAACASGSLAMIQGATKVASGRARLALVVGLDLMAEFIVAGFDSLKALSPTTVRPYDKYRDGLALSDGAGWALLCSEEEACKRGITGRVDFVGWGVSCDASHITAPCRQGSGLKRALEQLLLPEGAAIGGINGHGTGTPYNDAMEMLVFHELYGKEVPYCSVKGALGHSLGAAGVIEAVLSVRSLGEMVIPPTVGFITPDDRAGNVSGSTVLPLRSSTIVSCNSGFGGINAALAFSS